MGAYGNTHGATDSSIKGYDDYDCDGFDDDTDNCLEMPNGPDLGTCAKVAYGVIIGTGVTCLSYEDCAEDEYCQMEQGDCNENGCGDACECYADIAGTTGKVDLYDLTQMKREYNRTDCAINPCTANLNGDGKVDLSDLVIMKVQYNRNDCPSCL
jgi:hypothetical protein